MAAKPRIGTPNIGAGQADPAPSDPTIRHLVPFDHQTAITLTEAAQRMRGRRGGRLNVSCVRRWASKRGCRVRGYDGPALRLPAQLVGSVLYTMPQWLKAFEDELLARGEQVRGRNESIPRTRTVAEATQSHLAAVAWLESRGITVGGAT